MTLLHMEIDKIAWLELQHKAKIQDLLLHDLVSRILARYSLRRTTYERWTTHYGINYRPDYLPDCEGCMARDEECQDDKVCNILYSGRYPIYLIRAKMEAMGGNWNEVMNEGVLAQSHKA